MSRARRILLGTLVLLLGLAPIGAGPTPAYAAPEPQLVLVLDSSGSMKERVGGAAKIAIAKSALTTVVDKLPPAALVGLRVYGATVFDKSDRGACTDSQLVVPIGNQNRDALRAEIKKYKPYGETPISHSLKEAAKDLGGEGRRTILLVSDGEETCDVDPCATAEALAEQGIDLKIDVIGLGVRGQARNQLRCIADRGNGTYYDADSREEIEESLDKLATRAFRPFRLTGTPIRGTTKQAGAPTAAPGQYVDRFPGRDDPLYYRIPRSVPGSTLRVGFTARPKGLVVLGSLKLYDADGRECGWGIGSVVGGGGRSPLASGEVDSWRRDADDPCNRERELLAEITHSDDLAGERFELLVSEEPPVVSDRDLPPAEGTITWARRPVPKAVRPPVPGTSLSDAPTLPAGAYRASILTGETQVFAVPADWGQRVQVEVVVPPRRGALAGALDVSDSLNLQLLGSMRGAYTNLRVRRLPERSYSFINDDLTYRVAATSPTVRYLNRVESGSESGAATPGPQYVALNMSRGQERDFLVPYTLIVSVVGTAGAGRPEYVPSSTPTPSPTPSPSPSPSPSASTGPTPSASAPPATGSGGVPVPVVVAIGVGALLLGGLVAAGLRLRAPRRPAAPGG